MLIRVAVVTAGVVAFFLLAAAVGVNATPIRPDVKKVLSEPQQPASSADYVPARAGWDGPETPQERIADNATLEALSPAATARDARRSLLAAAIPDPRALAAIVLAILLLRRMRKPKPDGRVSGVALPATAPLPSSSPQDQPVANRPAA